MVVRRTVPEKDEGERIRDKKRWSNNVDTKLEGAEDKNETP
jgi:hypothetical protein